MIYLDPDRLQIEEVDLAVLAGEDPGNSKDEGGNGKQGERGEGASPAAPAVDASRKAVQISFDGDDKGASPPAEESTGDLFSGAAREDPGGRESDGQGELGLEGEQIQVRPDVVNAMVYRLRSGFVKHNVYITLGWIEQGGRPRPVEIFFNSKDLTRNPEYAILTRLISAIFRKESDSAFILEELRGIHDPNGGVFKNGRYMHSFYAEVADVIERFFYDVGILEPRMGNYVGGKAPAQAPVSAGDPAGVPRASAGSASSGGCGASGSPGKPSVTQAGADRPQARQADVSQATAGAAEAAETALTMLAASRAGGAEKGQLDLAGGERPELLQEINQQFKICPDCQERSLKMEAGCDVCVACGYSRCDN